MHTLSHRNLQTTKELHVISSFRSEVDENCALVRFVTKRVVVIYFRRIRTNSVPFQGSFKMGPICCPETSLGNYRYTLRNSPEERKFQ